MFRRLTFRVLAAAMTAAAIAAPGASAMPTQETATHAVSMQTAVRSAARVDAAAHAATMRRIGAKLVARTCG
jgi:hypothetical protein